MDARSDGMVVGIDHALDFGGFGDWVKVSDAFGDLDDFGCDRFSGRRSVWREKHLVKLFEIVSEAFDTVASL